MLYFLAKIALLFVIGLGMGLFDMTLRQRLGIIGSLASVAAVFTTEYLFASDRVLSNSIVLIILVSVLAVTLTAMGSAFFDRKIRSTRLRRIGLLFVIMMLITIPMDALGEVVSGTVVITSSLPLPYLQYPLAMVGLAVFANAYEARWRAKEYRYRLEPRKRSRKRRRTPKLPEDISLPLEFKDPWLDDPIFTEHSASIDHSGTRARAGAGVAGRKDLSVYQLPIGEERQIIDEFYIYPFPESSLLWGRFHMDIISTNGFENQFKRYLVQRGGEA